MEPAWPEGEKGIRILAAIKPRKISLVIMFLFWLASVQPMSLMFRRPKTKNFPNILA